MSGPPWRADRALDAEAACAAVRSQFPGLAVARLDFLASGWDHDVYASPDGWRFRFPRRRGMDGDLVREARVNALAARALRGSALAVPEFVLEGAPGPHFPYRFVGYHALPGVSGDAVSDARLDRETLVRTLGDAFARLHAVPPEDARAVGLAEECDGPAEWLRALVAMREEVAPLLPRDLAQAAAPWLAGAVALPGEFPGPPRFVHNDVCPDHVLVDPATGRATGLLDFADAALGDPALDFVAFVQWLGHGFAGALISAYARAGGATDPGLAERVRFLARATSLCWLRDAARLDRDTGRPAHVPKHVSWVRRALAPD